MYLTAGSEAPATILFWAKPPETNKIVKMIM